MTLLFNKRSSILIKFGALTCLKVATTALALHSLFGEPFEFGLHVYLSGRRLCLLAVNTRRRLTGLYTKVVTQLLEERFIALNLQ